MAITVARAVRYPNDFAEAHWLLDYRFGLIRRGFAGSLLSLAATTGLVRQSEQTIAAIAFAVFAALLLLFLAAAYRLLASEVDPDVGLVAAAVFATSPYIVMSAHFMGYMDHVFVLLGFASAWLARSGRLWPAAAAAAVGVLVHESFLLVGMPLVILGAVLRPNAPSSLKDEDLRPLALPIIAALAVLFMENVVFDLGVLRRQLEAHLSSFPFVGGDMNLFVPEWVTMDLFATWRGKRHAFWFHLSYRDLLRMMVPPTLFLIAAVAALAPAGMRRGRILWALLVTSAPLVLHSIAWDTARIYTYPIAVAFGSLWLVAAREPSAPAAGRRWLLLAAVPILVANVLARAPLMDHLVERFSDSTRAILYAPFFVGAAFVIVGGWRSRLQPPAPERGPSGTLQ
jgi:hypothetical protein